MDLPATPAPQRARLRASTIDLVVIWGWLGALTGLSRLPLLRRTGYAELFRTPATADLAQFATGVLPVWLYLVAGEAGGGHATRGKRAVGLTVVDLGGGPPSRSRIAARAAVKLLPWQLAHLAINRVVGISAGRRSARPAAVGFGAALALAGGSVVLATMRSDGRALHDLVAGTRVVPARGARP